MIRLGAPSMRASPAVKKLCVRIVPTNKIFLLAMKTDFFRWYSSDETYPDDRAFTTGIFRISDKVFAMAWEAFGPLTIFFNSGSGMGTMTSGKGSSSRTKYSARMPASPFAMKAVENCFNLECRVTATSIESRGKRTR